MERELLLLGLLRSHEQHGYRLVEFIENNLSTCTDLKKSTAYFLLDKMAKNGWVTTSEAQEGNRPRRQVYTITPAGEMVFEDLLRKNLETQYTTYFKGDTGLLFIQSLPKDEALTLLETRLEALRAFRSKLQSAPQHGENANWLIEHQIFHLNSEEAWLSRLIMDLNKNN